MTYEIKVVDASEKQNWNRFVEKVGGSVFHLFEWSQILEATYNFKPSYTGAFLDSKIVGVFPGVVTNNPLKKRLVSLPFADYASFLADPEVSSEMLTFVMDLCKKNNITLELHSLSEIPSLYNQHDSDTFILDTTIPFEQIWMEKFDRTMRKMIKRSAKKGVTVVKEDQNFIESYYTIYLETMKRLGKFPLSYNFYKNVFSYMGDKVESYSARYDGEIIAGLIIFNFNGKIYLWGNASKSKYLPILPNNALYSHVIQSACERGIREIDFGSTRLNSGHYRFKLEWGGTPKAIYEITNEVKNEVKPKNGRIRSLVVRYTPDAVLRTVSPLVFKYIY